MVRGGYGHDGDGEGTRAPRRSGSASYLPAILVTLIGAATVPLLALGPTEPGPFAVVFGPSTSAEAALRRVVRAGGEPIAPGPFANVIFAAGDEGFRDAVTEAGAWLLLGAPLAGCTPARRHTEEGRS